MLYSILGKGCKQVSVIKNNDYDLIIGEWQDGRFGSLRGNRKGNNIFGTTIHYQKGIEFVNVAGKPYYASLLEVIMPFFQTGNAAIPIDETVEIIRFLEAANESRRTGETVKL